MTNGEPSPTTRPFPEPFYGRQADRALWITGYVRGWRDAMTDAKGGDWSTEFPLWWPEPPVEPDLPGDSC